MYKIILFIIGGFFILINTSQAQTGPAFTNGNTILISIEGSERNYEFTSQSMLVRYNRNTQKLECILNISTLEAANNASPLSMIQDIFYLARFPELLIEIEAPVEKINAGNLSTETMGRRTRVFFQDVINEQILPILFTPENQALIFSTSFDMLLDQYQVQLPAKYMPMLTGRIMVSIQNARWLDNRPH
ncbi:hypothetical protein [Pontibacter sp. SGAir0037]|uniref:hypothetical protein n=1 Tax=Pontibacter sp. SGAir0037 TaxID=2571030 RepID=UPI0010CCCA38|nr:hypothetical protein [Pontibacter sp. SGAir0037]QCR21821.1 hypothetical protein C1N53_05360 [Pontibacter sp. SGAir0037]